MKCDQCDSAYINDVFCHEHGCPNIKRPIECDICGYEITEDDAHEGCAQ